MFIGKVTIIHLYFLSSLWLFVSILQSRIIGFHAYIVSSIAVTSKRNKKNQNGRCFNCGKQGHLTWIVGKGVIATIFFWKVIQREVSCLLKYAEGVAKAGIGVMITDQKGIGNVTRCHQKRGLMQAPILNFIHSFPVSMGDTQSQIYWKMYCLLYKSNIALEIIKDKTAPVTKTKNSERRSNKHFGTMLQMIRPKTQ